MPTQKQASSSFFSQKSTLARNVYPPGYGNCTLYEDVDNPSNAATTSQT